MTTLSLTAYAATHGASKQAAAKWKAAGVLVVLDGKVDVAASDKRMKAHGYGRFRSTERKPASTARPVVVPVVVPTAAAVDAASAPAAIDTIAAVVEDGQLSAFLDDLLAGRFKTKVDAEAIKENALAAKHILAARKEFGLVIDLDVAERAMFESGRRARDAWLNFTTRVGPLLAADLGIDQERLTAALAPYVHQQLTDLGTDSADFAGDA